MRLNELPTIEKPREKAIKLGISSLSNAELLAIIIRTGTTNMSAIDLAYELLKEFDGLEGIIKKEYFELNKIKGMKQAKCLSLLAISEICKRVLYKQVFVDKLTSPKEIFMYLEPRLGNDPQERCLVIFLNARNLVTNIKELFVGSLSDHLIHPRDIYREAVKENAGSIILIHNHPSGDPTPSKSDIATTREIFSLGLKMGIPLIDHIIIAKGAYYSLKSNNLF